MRKSGIVTFTEGYSGHNREYYSAEKAMESLVLQFNKWLEKNTDAEIIGANYSNKFHPDCSCSNSDGSGKVELVVTYLKWDESC